MKALPRLPYMHSTENRGYCYRMNGQALVDVQSRKGDTAWWRVAEELATATNQVFPRTVLRFGIQERDLK